MAKQGGKRVGAGRPKGSANKATKDVRAAVALLVEGNIDRMQSWLDRIAETDPDKAYELMIRTLEFNIPKLARAEIAGPGGAELQIHSRIDFGG